MPAPLRLKIALTVIPEWFAGSTSQRLKRNDLHLGPTSRKDLPRAHLGAGGFVP